MLTLSPRRTALVLIDLQHGITAMPLQPISGEEVAARGRAAAARFRQAGAQVVLLNVDFGADMVDAPHQPVDRPLGGGPLPADWSQLHDGLVQPGDLRVTKRQWGAFTGTSLEQQLRRRGIDTIVLGGIATNFGVESTARHAWELGFAVVVAPDLCASVSEELHRMTLEHVLPRVARIVPSDALQLQA
ncbi:MULTISPECIES: hydrolase [Pseudoxanthomonas]|jgi:nicotinamidase-related amidase|uniref:Hydrolase n=1 Tax=Pseudoxanthomonas winnipegensis TaxID=2480810 RepID=A0A4Q8L916_9GAMM|nr:hydrolase [Pseudoxanthomonas winnipegensis]RZZ81646.1 hydrolase [Pseudoxanthomonas winnipegensis]TAA06062.1 hydrolase [Pseudoxanthomonas winnipegensis]TAA16188.1 hydrolase [Pseudoxanthomonas winnipegensis]TAA24759.1 hydrolase [Pseudoxanthomonas winnipegensis]TAA40011.1 hydrolase [Pseudoxanthomonas winnipegensis]